MAYVTAATNGLTSESERLSKVLIDSGASLPTLPSNPQLMMPPTPIRSTLQNTNWPEIEIERDVFADAVRVAQESKSLNENEITQEWEDENLDSGKYSLFKRERERAIAIYGKAHCSLSL